MARRAHAPDTVSYQTQRHRVLTPGEIAKLPDGRGLLLQGADWELIALTKWYESEPWRASRAECSRGSSNVEIPA